MSWREERERAIKKWPEEGLIKEWTNSSYKKILKEIFLNRRIQGLGIVCNLTKKYCFRETARQMHCSNFVFPEDKEGM